MLDSFVSFDLIAIINFVSSKMLIIIFSKFSLAKVFSLLLILVLNQNDL